MIKLKISKLKHGNQFKLNRQRKWRTINRVSPLPNAIDGEDRNKILVIYDGCKQMVLDSSLMVEVNPKSFLLESGLVTNGVSILDIEEALIKYFEAGNSNVIFKGASEIHLTDEDGVLDLILNSLDGYVKYLTSDDYQYYDEMDNCCVSIGDLCYCDDGSANEVDYILEGMIRVPVDFDYRYLEFYKLELLIHKETIKRLKSLGADFFHIKPKSND